MVSNRRCLRWSAGSGTVQTPQTCLCHPRPDAPPAGWMGRMPANPADIKRSHPDAHCPGICYKTPGSIPRRAGRSGSLPNPSRQESESYSPTPAASSLKRISPLFLNVSTAVKNRVPGNMAAQASAWPLSNS
jgi:hypothetical protein